MAKPKAISNQADKTSYLLFTLYLFVEIVGR